MEKYEIHIGDTFNIESKKFEPRQKIIITKEQKEILERFADTRKDKDLNTIYKINDCEFKIELEFFDFEAYNNYGNT